MSASTVTPAISSVGWPIWGHDRAVRELQAAASGSPRHAYILTGPDRIGKQALATEFASALLAGETPTPERLSSSRHRRVLRGVHPDVTLFDLESQRERAKGKNLTLTIETVRDITSSIALRPIEADWKIIIVDDVETMLETAQEAFLKTLEEPPSYAVVLLLTNDAEQLLPTVRSRCVTTYLQPTTDVVVREALVASGVSAETAESIAEVSGGRVGWAFHAANQPDALKEQQATLRFVEEWVSHDAYGRMVQAILLADTFSKDRPKVFEQLAAVEAHWRTRLYEAASATAVPDTLPSVLRALKSVESCIASLEANVRPRTALQHMVMQWPAA